jgi:hypothetical protein
MVARVIAALVSMLIATVAGAQMNDGESVTNPLSFATVARALERHEPINDEAWERIAKSYRAYLDRIESTCFGERYAEFAPAPYVDDTVSRQRPLEDSLRAIRRARGRAAEVLGIERAFIDDVATALAAAGRPDAERFRSWHESLIVERSASSLYLPQPGRWLVESLRLLRLRDADATLVHELADRVEDRLIAIQRSRATIEERISTEWERQRRLLPPPPPEPTDEEVEEAEAKERERAENPDAPPREPPPNELYWRDYWQRFYRLQQDSFRLTTAAAAEAESLVRAALPSLTLAGQRMVREALTAWLVPDLGSIGSSLSTIHRTIPDLAPSAVPAARDALLAWRLRDDEIAGRELDAAREFLRRTIESVFPESDDGDERQWRWEAAYRFQNECRTVRAERETCAAAMVEAIRPLWGDSAPAGAAPDATAGVGPGSEQAPDAPPPEGVLPESSPDAPAMPRWGRWTAASWSEWSAIWTDLWAGLDGVRGMPNSADRPEPAWSNADPLEFDWSPPAPLDSEVQGFCERIGVDASKRLVIATMVTGLRERRTELLATRMPALDTLLEAFTWAANAERPKAADVLRAQQALIAELRGLETSFFEELAVVLDEAQRPAVRLWQLRHELGTGSWFQAHRREVLDGSPGLHVAARHGNLIEAIDQAELDQPSRQRAEAIAITFVDRLRESAAALDVAELRCHTIQSELETSIEEAWEQGVNRRQEQMIVANYERGVGEQRGLVERAAKDHVATERALLEALRKELPPRSYDSIELHHLLLIEPESRLTTTRFETLIGAYRNRLAALPKTKDATIARFERVVAEFNDRDETLAQAMVRLPLRRVESEEHPIAMDEVELQQRLEWHRARRYAEFELFKQTLDRCFPVAERRGLPMLGW